MNARRSVASALRWLAASVGLGAAVYAAYIVGAWRRYGRAPRPTSEEADPLLDQFMPAYDVVERRHARFDISAADTLAAASALDIRRVTLIHALFKARALALRSHGAEAEPQAPRELLAWMQHIGWTLLAEIPRREIVMGTVTQPWSASPTFRALPAEAFAAFREPGFVKIAWTLRAEPTGEGESALYHETRAVATDAAARARFRRYWAIFSPGIILIRWALLGPLSPIRRGAQRRTRNVTSPPAVRSRYARLSPIDTLQLRTENLNMPTCIGGLCVVEADPLLDAHGALDLKMITRRLERRLTRVPELRRIVAQPPALGGSLTWVDDPHFSIGRHIHTAVVSAPGDEASLLEMTERLLRPLLDRSRPLWELWFITGLEDGRVALLFKLHHAVADGLAAIALMSSFFDLAPDTPDPPATTWTPTPAPSARALIADNLRCRVASAGDALRHPAQSIRRAAALLAYTARTIPEWSAAPRTSLNTLTQPGRYQRVLHLDLEEARAVAHAHGAKINDVILALVTGGVRALLLRRGEPVQDVELLAGVPATLRSLEAARELGNVVGALTVRLPVGEADSVQRLARVAAAARAAKAEQPLSERTTRFALGLVGWLATHGYSFAAQQRMINFMVSNVVGPTAPLYVLGARIDEVIPLSGPFGNVTLAFGAMSYCGRLHLVVIADRAACPDIDTLVAGMKRAWEELARVRASI